MNQELVEQLRNGKIAAEHSGTLEQLEEVLKAAFPQDICKVSGIGLYYHRYDDKKWYGTNTKPNLPIIKIQEFYSKELKRGDRIDLYGKTYTVCMNLLGGYYLLSDDVNLYDNDQYDNDQRFIDAGIKDKKAFTKKVLGYAVEGIFPPCYSLKDLTKLVDVIREPKTPLYYTIKPEKLKEYNAITRLTFKETDQFTTTGDVITTLRKSGSLHEWMDAVYEEESVLPKIGCSQGEETRAHIKYGGKAMSKKTLRHMKENGIVAVTVERGCETFQITKKDLELIYKIAEK